MVINSYQHFVSVGLKKYLLLCTFLARIELRPTPYGRSLLGPSARSPIRCACTSLEPNVRIKYWSGYIYDLILPFCSIQPNYLLTSNFPSAHLCLSPIAHQIVSPSAFHFSIEASTFLLALVSVLVTKNESWLWKQLSWSPTFWFRWLLWWMCMWQCRRVPSTGIWLGRGVGSAETNVMNR